MLCLHLNVHVDFEVIETLSKENGFICVDFILLQEVTLYV